MRKKGRRWSHDEMEHIGLIPHSEVDHMLGKLGGIPITVSGARDDPESALANLLAALEEAGLIVDSTTTS